MEKVASQSWQEAYLKLCTATAKALVKRAKCRKLKVNAKGPGANSLIGIVYSKKERKSPGFKDKIESMADRLIDDTDAANILVLLSDQPTGAMTRRSLVRILGGKNPESEDKRTSRRLAVALSCYGLIKAVPYGDYAVEQKTPTDLDFEGISNRKTPAEDHLCFELTHEGREIVEYIRDGQEFGDAIVQFVTAVIQDKSKLGKRVRSEIAKALSETARKEGER